MSEELKPCPNPKCGCKTPRVIKEFSGDTEFFFVVCPDCSMAGPIEACSRDAAIAAWNSLPRAPHIATIDELLRLREQVEALTNTRAVQLQDKL